MNWLRRSFQRRQMVNDLSEEMRQHLEEKIEALVAGGMAREEAVHAARRAFGNATLLEERSREIWMWPLVENLWADVKFALRQLRKSPGFTLTAMLTLALGIGATTAIFSLFQQVWLHHLPVANSEQLVLLRATGPPPPGWLSTHGDNTYYFSVPMYRDLQQQSGKIFSNMAAIGPFYDSMRAGNSTGSVQGDFVSGGYFATLRLRPVIGRFITPEDDIQHHGNPVVVLSYDEWQQSFGGSPSALNRVIDINRHPFTVIGVAPPGFIGIDRNQRAQFFVPMSMEPTIPTHDRSFLDLHNAIWINIVARLQPGISRQRAEAALNPIWLSLRKNELTLFPHNQRAAQQFLQTHLFLTKGADGLPFLQHSYGGEVGVLMAMALMVLLIACVNLANLMLVRAAIRAKEIGVRAALGASRMRLMIWVLIEGLLLTASGGAAGIGLGLVAMGPLSRRLLGEDAQIVPIASSPGMHLLFITMAALLLTGLLSCLPSMLLMTRPDLNQILHENATQNPKRAGRLRPILTSAQILLSFVLLVAACLLARSLYNLRNVDLGMRTDHVLQFFVDARDTRIGPKQSLELMRQLAEAIRREPGVEDVGYASNGILSGDESGSNIFIAGHKPFPSDAMPPDRNMVSQDFFTTLGIPLLAGRVLRDADGASAPKVAVINEEFARKYFGSIRGALGQMFCFGPTKVPDITIVGVVRNTRSVEMNRKPFSTTYIPFAQGNRNASEFYVRTAIAPSMVMNEIRRAARNVNSALPLNDMRTLDEQISGDIHTQRILAVLSIAFGLLAALLAGIGLYGVLAYSTTQRTREIGIRMALGANREDVVELVLRQAVWMTGGALILGMPLAVLLSRYLRTELFQVAYMDPWSFLAAGLFLFFVIAAAAFAPARRAASVNPVQALRAE